MWRPENILCVSPAGAKEQIALERAVFFAKNTQARLTVVSGGDISTDTDFKFERKILDDISNAGILKEVQDSNYDLVIKTAEDEGFKSRLFSNQNMHLVRNCTSPLWILKPKSKPVSRIILAAVDASEDYPEEELATRLALNMKILEIASALALNLASELRIISVWSARYESSMRGPLINTPAEEVDKYTKDLQEAAETSFGKLLGVVKDSLEPESFQFLSPTSELLKGSPADRIPDYANELNPGLVVMGTVARTGIPGFIMGNTAEKILTKLNQSVLAIKPDGFDSGS